MENQDVEPAVVVEVVDPRPPAHILRIGLRKARSDANVVESALAVVLHQAVVVRVAHPQVEPAAARDVRKYRPHRRGRLAILSIGNTGVAGDLFKCPVMLVMEEKVLRAVVGDVDVGPAIAVEVSRSHAHGAADGCANAGLLGHIGEGAVAVVVEQLVRLALIVERAGVVIGGIIVVVVRIELHIAADK